MTAFERQSPFQNINSPATLDGACPAGLTAGDPASLGRDPHLLLRIGVVGYRFVGEIVRPSPVVVNMRLGHVTANRKRRQVRGGFAPVVSALNEVFSLGFLALAIEEEAGESATS